MSHTATLLDRASDVRSEVRTRILDAAMNLLAKEGRDSVTTRAVAQAAGVQPPILYRHFGDKRGLLDALADYGFAAYLARKRKMVPIKDPVNALRAGWDLHVDFGLLNPANYLLMYADPNPENKCPAAKAAFQMLATRGVVALL